MAYFTVILCIHNFIRYLVYYKTTIYLKLQLDACCIFIAFILHPIWWNLI